MAITARSANWPLPIERLPGSVRTAVAAAAVLRTLERLGAGGVALTVIGIHPRDAIGWGVAWGGFAIVRAALTRWARRETRARLLVAAASALVHGAAVDRVDREEGLIEMVLDGATAAELSLCEHLPDAVGTGTAVLVFLAGATVANPGAGSLSLAALAIGVLSIFVARRTIDRAESSTRQALSRFVGRIVTFASAHLQLSATERGERVLGELERRAHDWRLRAARTERLSAWIGRAPFILILICGAAVGLNDRRIIDERVGVALIFVTASAALSAARAVVELRRGARSVEVLESLLRQPPLPAGGGNALPLLPKPVTAEDVTIELGNGTERTRALTAVSFEWEPGRILIVRGPNGSGKSTLLRTLAAVHTPSDGQLRLADRPLHEHDLGEWRRLVTYVPQDPFIPPQVDVREACVALGQVVVDESLRRWLSTLGVLDSLEQKRRSDPLGVRIGTLSAGQRHRVALAAALAEERPVVLLDEPDAFLDARAVSQLASALATHCQSRLVAIAAHSPELAAIGATTVDLSEGRSRIARSAPIVA